MTPATAFRIWQRAAVGGLALPFCCFGCFFQPSWANGWPGVSQATLISSVFSFAIFLAVLSFGGWLTFILANDETRHRMHWRHFLSFFMPAVAIGASIALVSFWYAFSAPEFKH